MTEALIVAILLIATAADALRDVWTAGPVELRKGWWPRHVAKWVAFYLPLVALMAVAGLPLSWWPLLAGAGWIVWRFTARRAGVRWPSWWSRLL